jgi:hypothetical protein
VVEELKNISRATLKRRAIPVTMLLILTILLSAGSGLYAGASFFAQQANVTTTTTIFTTTTSWTTSTIWSTVTEVVQGVLTTIEYTTSTSTITQTLVPTYNQQQGTGTANHYPWASAMWFTKFTAEATGTITKVGIDVIRAAGNARVALYGDSSGRPSALLGQSADTAISSTGWNDIPLTSGVQVTGGTVYWFAFQCNSGSLQVHDSGVGSAGAGRSYPYGSFAGSAGTVVTPSWMVNMRSTYVMS